MNQEILDQTMPLVFINEKGLLNEYDAWLKRKVKENEETE